MCSGLTAYAALKRHTNRPERGPVLLIGLGGVGMMGLAITRALFTTPPIVADIDAEKRKAALAAGAAQAVCRTPAVRRLAGRASTVVNFPPADQTRLVIVGATGMVGGYALRYALGHPAIGLVTAIGRSMLGISHPKLKEVLHPDFADCSALADALSSQNAAVFCLGAYTGAVSDAELRKITVDYTIEFARALHAASAGAAFSFLSGSGADPTGRSRLPFARSKGEAERALLAMGFFRVYIFRPAYMYPVDPRKEPNVGYRLLRAIYPAFRALFPNQVVRADDLARAMVNIAVRGADKTENLVLENRDIRAMVKASHP
jgi:uncharacterized protein YbjT (DUF2867 family)